MSTFNRLHHFHTSLLTTVLLSLAVIALTAMPVGLSMSTSGLSFGKQAAAMEKDERSRSGYNGTQYITPVARAHASVKSVVGILAFFEDSIFSSFDNASESGELDLAIAELEMQMENTELGDAERTAIEVDLAEAREKSDTLIEVEAMMSEQKGGNHSDLAMVPVASEKSKQMEPRRSLSTGNSLSAVRLLLGFNRYQGGRGTR